MPPGQRLAGDDPHLSWWDVSSGWETDLLMEWWGHAAATETHIVAPDTRNLLSGTSRIVQAALLAVSQSRFFAGLAEKALISDLKQTHRYLTEPELRTTARDRVRALACHLVPNGSQAHDATHYLTKQVTGAALALGLD
ncbi:hypothetical protein ACH4MW_10875 [Streptomyces luteogriseus]|uniref:hypothetical protein n=1 Tax=Streptomyces luteogriseus TaxID=68233 RepID=UPI00378D42A5